MGKGDDWMTTVIERTEGHYEVQGTSHGEAYIWCPECVVVQCDCGKRTVLSASETVCGCGTDHAALVRQVLASQTAPHPWDAEYDEWRKRQEEYLSDEHLFSEDTYSLELSRLD
jgi:hypothetical protein